METRENLIPKAQPTVHHWIAGVIIILFSLYYFALQSQSYDIGAFEYYGFLLEPELLEFYRTSPEVLATDGINYSPILGWIKGNVIAYNQNVNDIIFTHIITFNLLLRNLNFITGHTIISIKILVLPKLLIFLFGMYALLYYLTKGYTRHFSSPCWQSFRDFCRMTTGRLARFLQVKRGILFTFSCRWLSFFF